jgi:hypothetical protein
MDHSVLHVQGYTRSSFTLTLFCRHSPFSFSLCQEQEKDSDISFIWPLCAALARRALILSFLRAWRKLDNVLLLNRIQYMAAPNRKRGTIDCVPAPPPPLHGPKCSGFAVVCVCVCV